MRTVTHFLTAFLRHAPKTGPIMVSRHTLEDKAQHTPSFFFIYTYVLQL